MRLPILKRRSTSSRARVRARVKARASMLWRRASITKNRRFYHLNSPSVVVFRKAGKRDEGKWYINQEWI